jgi:hypothetical protein
VARVSTFPHIAGRVTSLSLVAAVLVVLAAAPGAWAGSATTVPRIVSAQGEITLYGPRVQLTLVTERARAVRVQEVGSTRTLIARRPTRTAGSRQTWILRDRGRIDWRGNAYRLRIRACAQTQCRVVTRAFTAPDTGPSATATPVITSVRPAYDPATRRLAVGITAQNADNAYALLLGFKDGTGSPRNPFRRVSGTVSGSTLNAAFVADGIQRSLTYALGVAATNSRSGKTAVIPPSTSNPFGPCLLPPVTGALVPSLPCLAVPPLPVLPPLPVPGVPAVPAVPGA